MDSKVQVFNHAGQEIGKTYARRAKQLVNKQRAEWTDLSQTAIRFYRGMESTAEDIMPLRAAADVESNQLVFALWDNKYYYPAVTGEIFHNKISVVFLDGASGMVAPDEVVELNEALVTMELQGKWRRGMFWYKGTLTSRQPLIMHYDDGDVEHLHLIQLRGKLPNWVDLRK